MNNRSLSYNDRLCLMHLLKDAIDDAVEELRGSIRVNSMFFWKLGENM